MTEKIIQIKDEDRGRPQLIFPSRVGDQNFRNIRKYQNGDLELAKGVSLSDNVSAIQKSRRIIFDNPEILNTAIDQLSKSGVAYIYARGKVITHDGSWDHDDASPGNWTDNDITFEDRGMVSCELRVTNGVLDKFSYYVDGKPEDNSIDI